MKEWLRRHPNEVPAGLGATLSTSHKLRDGLRRSGWTIRETEQQVLLIRPTDVAQGHQIEEILDPTSSEDSYSLEGERSDPEQSFGLEHQLRDFLAQNISTFPIDGHHLSVYVDAAGRDGIEFPTPVGRIDLLATDENGAFVVFELKRADVPDRAIGQLARYMGWIRHTIGKNKDVRGIIVGKSIDESTEDSDLPLGFLPKGGGIHVITHHTKGVE